MMNILEIYEITKEIVDYYISNPNEAMQQYSIIIDSAKIRGLDKKALDGYFEIHHIVPRCKGGSDDSTNLVLLSYREHVLAHLLLYAIDPDNKNLFLSFSLMIEIKDRIQLSEIEIDLTALEIVKFKRSEIMSGDNNPMKNPDVAKKVSEFKKKQPGFFTGKHHTEETKRKLREKTLSLNFVGEGHPMFGRTHTQETREKLSKQLSGENHPMYGKHLSEEARAKLSKTRLEKPIYVSPDNIEFLTLKSAAQFANVHPKTLKRWIEKFPQIGWKKKQRNTANL